jgi:hypothetical protein
VELRYLDHNPKGVGRSSANGASKEMKGMKTEWYTTYENERWLHVGRDNFTALFPNPTFHQDVE